MISSTITVCFMAFLLIIMIVYFFKGHINSLENKIFSKLIIINFLGLTLQVIGYILTFTNINVNSISYLVLVKLVLSYYLAFETLMVLYIYIISNKVSIDETKIKKYNQFKKIIIALTVISLVLTTIFPLEVIKEGNYFYPEGLAVKFLYSVVGIGAVYIFLEMFRHIKNIFNKEYIPLFFYIVFGGIGIIIQFNNPSILIMTSLESLVIILMYFTIENPDMKMIEQLNIARDQADKANKAKSDFLSSMSHEIRTPLNAIVGFSEAVKASSTLDEAIENANDIVEASQTLLEIVNGVLDISKIESGKLEIVNSNYNAHELFLNVSKLMQHKASEKALEYIVEIAPDIPNNLYGDYASIKKVITNLLSNAVKYTEKGYVRYSVNCVKKDDICRLIISVEDSGRGIKESQINKLFDKFQRLDEDKNTTIEGTGLGLAITKRLVELMNGQIVVQSKYGEGSKFTVTLDQRISVNQVIKTEEHIQNDDIDIHNKKILVVDDNTLNLKVASKVLESFTTNITLVDSGFECINKLNEGNTYDVILLDDMMPKLSGKETLIKLKDMNISIPIVALTANAISGEREKYIEAGFDEYLSKPIDKKELERVLKKVISQNKVETDEVVIIEENI